MHIVKDKSWYCYLVLVVSYLAVTLLTISTYGNVSVLVYIWLKQFGISSELAAWAPTVLGGSMYLTGPLVSMLLHALGPWKTQLLGGVMLCATTLATAFATEFWHVMIVYAFLQGLAGSIINIASTDIVSYYFDKYQAKVYAGLIVALSVGLAVGPSFTERLIQLTSYKTALIIQCCINGIIPLTAIIFRGPFWLPTTTDKTSIKGKGENNLSISAENNVNTSEPTKSPTTIDITNINVKGEDNPSFLADNDVNSRVVETESDANGGDSSTEMPTEAPALSLLASHREALKDPVFIIILIFNLLEAVGENTFNSLGVEYIVKLGSLNLEQAALGLTLTGVSNVVGSIFTTVISHWEFDGTLYSAITILMMGIVTVLMPLAKSQASLYILCIILGFGTGTYLAALVPWLTHLFSRPELMIIRLSYVFLSIGIGSAIGPVAVGYFTKAIGNADSMFYFIGTFPILAALILGFYWVKLKVDSCIAARQSEDPVVQA